jgi:predicted nucleotide-binding protein (sugar kinase/HSP70/actin superfamily)
MSKKGQNIEVVCPCCQATLLLDSATGLVLHSAEKKSGYSFESGLESVRQRKEKSEQLFEEAFQKEEQRRRSLEDKFRKALESKDELDEPPSPWEID